MKKRKSKGFILAFTTIILFTVTSIVTLLVTVVIYHKTQKNNQNNLIEAHAFLQERAMDLYKNILSRSDLVANETFAITNNDLGPNVDYLKKNGTEDGKIIFNVSDDTIYSREIGINLFEDKYVSRFKGGSIELVINYTVLNDKSTYEIGAIVYK